MKSNAPHQSLTVERTVSGGGGGGVPRTFVVQVGEKKYKHKSSAADARTLVQELVAKYNVPPAPTAHAVALWHEPSAAFRRPALDADLFADGAVLKLKLVEVGLAYPDVVDVHAADAAAAAAAAADANAVAPPLSVPDHQLSARSESPSHTNADFGISRRQIELEQSRQLFVLRTHYEYAFTGDADDADAAERADPAAPAVTEELYGLCKLQLHPRNFKALRAAALPDVCAPVVSLAGPTASGKSALLREFSPDIAPVVGFSGQPLPTTSNVNYVRASMPSLRFLDMEGEDGGLPLTQVYTGARSEPDALDEAIEVDDALRVTRAVMAQFDQAELERYMEARRSATRDALPRLAYVLSDVVVYVEAADSIEAAMDNAKLYARVALFATSCATAVVSALPPALVVVQTQCPVRNSSAAMAGSAPSAAAAAALGNVDFNTTTSSEALRALDTQRLLADTFASVHVVRMPDVDRQELYAAQVAAFTALVSSLATRSLELRAERGLWLTERGWFDVAADVVRSWNTPCLAVSQFLQRHNSVGSEASARIAARAYEFFHRVYHTPETDWFVRCRRAAARLCAIECVAAVVEDECSALDAATFDRALDLLLARIDSRAPCQYALDSVRCLDERLTHGAVHHLEQSTSRIEDAFRFADAADTVESLRAAFSDTLRLAAKVQRRRLSGVNQRPLGGGGGGGGGGDRASSLLAQRLAIYREVVTVDAATPLEDPTCWLCLRRPPSVLLTCTHSVCAPCFAELLQNSAGAMTTGAVTCPVCNVNVVRIAPQPDWRGRCGVRVLALDGATLASARNAADVLRHLEQLTSLRVSQLFDLIGGVSLGALLAIVLGVCNADAARAAQLLEQLRAAAAPRPAALLLEYPLEQPYDEPVWIPATKFDQLLRAATHDDAVGWSELFDSAGANRSPKVFAATSDATIDGAYLYSNYPQGERSAPAVDCVSLTAWEAARACAAASDAYENNARVFIDAALGGAPSAEALAADEALLLTDFARPVDVFVSINPCAAIDAVRRRRADAAPAPPAFATIDALRATAGVYRSLTAVPRASSSSSSSSSSRRPSDVAASDSPRSARRPIKEPSLTTLPAPRSAAPVPTALEKSSSRRRMSEKLLEEVPPSPKASRTPSLRRQRATEEETFAQLAQRLVALTYRAELQGAYETVCGVSSRFVVRCVAPRLRASKVEVSAWTLTPGGGDPRPIATEKLSRRSPLLAALAARDPDVDEGADDTDELIRAPAFACEYAIEASGLHRIVVKVRVVTSTTSELAEASAMTPDGAGGWWHVSGSPFVVRVRDDVQRLGPLAYGAQLDVADLAMRVECASSAAFERRLAADAAAPPPTSDDMLLLRDSARRLTARLGDLKLAVPATLASAEPADWLRWRSEVRDALYRACVVQLGLGCDEASDERALRAAVDFVRRRAVAWMALHGDARVGSHTLRSLVEQRSGRRWSEYLASVGGADARGDLFVLFAVSECFGVPLLLVTGTGAAGEAFLLWHEPRALLRAAPLCVVHWNEANFAALTQRDRDQLARVPDVPASLLQAAFAKECESEATMNRGRQQRRQAAIDGAVEAVEKAVEIAANLRATAVSDMSLDTSGGLRRSPPALRSPLAGAKPRVRKTADRSSDTESSSSTTTSRSRARPPTLVRESPSPEPGDATSSPSRYRSLRTGDAQTDAVIAGSRRRSTLRTKPSRTAAAATADEGSASGTDELALLSVSQRMRHHSTSSQQMAGGGERSQDDGSDSGTRGSSSRRTRNGSNSSITAAPDASGGSSPPDSPSGHRRPSAGAAEAARAKSQLASALKMLPSLTVEAVRASGGHADVSNSGLTVLPAALTPLAPILYSLDARHNEIDALTGSSVRVTTESPRDTSPRSSDEGGSPQLAHMRRSPARTSPRLRAAMIGGATLAQFTGLRTLLLAHNRIALLPPAVFDALQALEVLDLSHNLLSSLPSTIGELASLRQLNVAHNKLDHLPPQFVNLDALVLLDVSFNQLQMMPAFIADLESLAVLRTEGNPVRSSEMRALFAQRTDAVVHYLDANKRALRKLHRLSSSTKLLLDSAERSAGAAAAAAAHLAAHGATDIADLLRSDTKSLSPSTSSASGLSRSSTIRRTSTQEDSAPSSPLSQSFKLARSSIVDEQAPSASPRPQGSPANKQVALVRSATGRRNSLSRSMASMLNMVPTADVASLETAASAVPASPVALLRAEKSGRRLSGDVSRLLLNEFDDAPPAAAAAAAVAPDMSEAVAAAAQVALINAETMHYVLPREQSTSKGSRLAKRGSRRLSALELAGALGGGAGSGGSGAAPAAAERVASGGSGLRRNLLMTAHHSATHASVAQALAADGDGEGEGAAGEDAVTLEEGKFVPLTDFDAFFEGEHVSFLGPDANGRTIVLSALRELAGHATAYRALLRTEEGDERLWLPVDAVKVDGKNKLARPKDLLAAATRLRPELLQGAQLKAYKDARVPAELMAFENTLRMKGYKFGVVYAKDGQSTEDDALANESGSERFDEFLAVLGQTIVLEGWPNYRAGLDVAKNTTGTQSVYTMFHDCEVMFHVSTLLPMQPCREGERVQQLARKRHIGNDIVVIVFQDGTTPFDVASVASEFNHVWFVVQPLKMAGQTHFRLTIVSKNGVGEFGPPFAQSVFANDAAFRTFLLAKLINAERAAYQAPGFAKPIRRSRQMLLDSLHEAVRNISKSSGATD